MRFVCFLWVAVLAAAQQYRVSVVAGGGAPPLRVVASEALTGRATAIAADSHGSVYFAAENCVFRIDSSGEMARIAGNARQGYSGDGGAAVDAELNLPGGLAFDAQGNLYIADSWNQAIRKVTPAGTITTVPGSAMAIGAGFSGPTWTIATAASGDLFVSNRYANSVWKLAPSGALTRFAGNGAGADSGDGGPAASAGVAQPLGVAVDGAGNVFIVQNARVRKVSPAGIITTVAGTGVSAESGDGGPAIQAQLLSARAIAVDSAGSLYIAEANRVRKISALGIISTVAGSSAIIGAPGDGGLATSAVLTRVVGVAVTPGGDLYIADSVRIRHVSPSGIIETLEGAGESFTGDGGPALSAQLNSPSAVALDDGGNLYVADDGSRIRKVGPNGVITTVAGGQTQGYAGDGGPATAARMQLYPGGGMVVDGSGNLLVVEQVNGDVRKISPQRTISTVAGPGLGYSGDGGPASKAQFSFPNGLAIDGAGNLFIADTGNGLIRKVDTKGQISRFAGNYNLRNQAPYSLATDEANNVYASDMYAGGVTKYSPTGNATNVAPAVYAASAIAVDRAGNIYGFAASGLVKIAPNGSTETISTVGDSLAVGAMGTVFVADSALNMVFKLEPVSEPPPPRISYILGAATGWELTGIVAPGEIVTLYGAGLGPAQLLTAELDDAGKISTEIGGAQVLFDGHPAPLVYVSATQSAAVVPYGVSSSTAVTVRYQGQASQPVTLPVAWTAPGLFTADASGRGQAAALNQDRSYNSAARPAAIGEIVSLFGTGEGQTSPAGTDGKLAAGTIPSPVLPVRVWIGGTPAEILYAGGAPGQVAGLMQINARIPAGITPGDAVAVALQIGEVRGPERVTIAVR